MDALEVYYLSSNHFAHDDFTFAVLHRLDI